MDVKSVILTCVFVISAPLIHSFILYSLFLFCSFWTPMGEQQKCIVDTHKKSQ